MRIFVAGGTGAIGRRLVPTLVAAGHEVGVLTRTTSAADEARAAGAEPCPGDARVAAELTGSVVGFGPDVVINQLTSLPRSLLDLRQARRGAELTNQLRREAGPNLVAAARDAGASRVITQSISFAQPASLSPRPESDPLYLDAPRAHRQVVAAVAANERAVVDSDLEGIVLRYGAFYGPGTYFAAGEAYPSMLHRRLLPVIGQGGGTWALVHLDDAVAATVHALHASPGVYNVCDDDPVLASELLPWMADAIGARAPRRLPRALFSVGPATILRYLIDEQPPVSTDAARSVFGWSPEHPSWRDELGPILRGDRA